MTTYNLFLKGIKHVILLTFSSEIKRNNKGKEQSK